MATHKIVSQDEWLDARKRLLAREKEFTRMRDELSRQRRELPWVRVEKDYIFDGPDGKETLAGIFDGRSQLIVYHFMYGPDWEAGCPACSFWADNFNGVIPHLNQRGVTFVAISRAPLEKLHAFRKRMGWSFKWLSSHSNDFNYDYGVSFPQEQQEQGKIFYNYAMTSFPWGPEAPGISVFFKDEDGAVFHTYSCYARGLDMMNTAYHYLDLVPKGRDEEDLQHTMAWVQLRDEYGR